MKNGQIISKILMVNKKSINLMIYIWSKLDKMLKKWTLKKIFPRFSILVLKSTSFITDFAYHGFLFPPKISDKRGPPVPGSFLEEDHYKLNFYSRILIHA